jgi:hypothetical protein
MPSSLFYEISCPLVYGLGIELPGAGNDDELRAEVDSLFSKAVGLEAAQSMTALTVLSMAERAPLPALLARMEKMYSPRSVRMTPERARTAWI